MKRDIRLLENTRIIPCPKCGNNTRFVLHAEQFAEDCCETFVVCVCGHEPTEASGNRYENVWGEMNNNAASIALDCWNDVLTPNVL